MSAIERYSIFNLRRAIGSFRISGLLILAYFALCSTLYDPIVLVDDTPRKPLFKGVLSPISAHHVYSSIRDKLQPLFEENKSAPLHEDVVFSQAIFLNFSFCFLLFFNLSSKKYKLFSKSMPIRAPSL